MASEILSHVQAAHSILDAFRGKPKFATVSQSQRTKLHQLLLRIPHLANSDFASIAKAVQEAKFDATDEEVLLDALAEASATKSTVPAAAGGSRKSLQDFQSFVHYLPASVWEKAKEGHMQEVVSFVVLLGLRNATESTSRDIALIILFMTEGFEKTQQMPPDSKLALIKAVKQSLKTRAKGVCEPLVWISSLPKDPQEFRVKHQGLYDSIYGSDSPAPCRITEVAMEQLRLSTRMRGVKRGSVELAFPGQSASLPEPLVAFGHGMMQQMMAMQNQIAQLSGQGRPAPAPCPLITFPPHVKSSCGPPLALQAGPVGNSIVGSSNRSPASLVGGPIGLSENGVAVQAGHACATPGLSEGGGSSLGGQKSPLALTDGAARVGSKVAKKSVAEATAELQAELALVQPKAGRLAKKKEKAKGKAQGKANAKDLNMSSGCSKGKAKDVSKNVKVFYSNERTRSQFQCRCTGVAGMQGKQFKHDGTKAGAMAAEMQAKKWCNDKRKELGLRVEK